LLKTHQQRPFKVWGTEVKWETSAGGQHWRL